VRCAPQAKTATKWYDERVKRKAVAALVAGLCAWNCTTYVQPTLCKPGDTWCGGIHDATFCDYVAVEVAGSECATLGLVPAKHFCVVTAAPCTGTHYAVKDRDCTIASYQSVGESPRNDCGEGTPMFINRSSMDDSLARVPK